MTAQKANNFKSLVDWSAYAVIIGLIVSMHVSMNGQGQMLAGIEAWIRVAANTIHIPYGN